MIRHTNHLDNGVIALTHTVVGSHYQQLVSVTLHFDVAPTTAENLTITLDSGEGPEYDTLLYTVDPSVTAMTDLLWQPDEPLLLRVGDAVDVAYANTDARVWGGIITMQEV